MASLSSLAVPNASRTAANPRSNTPSRASTSTRMAKTISKVASLPIARQRRFTVSSGTDRRRSTVASHDAVLGRIGNTSLLALRRLVPANGARILLKQESENPTGSMKDRMALAMIEAGETDGRLPAGGPVVEYTAGSTGVSLALVCAVKGHLLHIVSSDAFAREKLDHMRILGATLRIVHSEDGRMTEQLTLDMVEAARAI